jgi:hypothetical protein
MSLLMLEVSVHPALAGAQSADRVVVSVPSAPVFVKPDRTMTPQRLAKEGSVLNVIAGEGEWYRSEFQDPQFGRSVGYIEKRHVSVQAVASQARALDLTVAESHVATGFGFTVPRCPRSAVTGETGPASSRRPQVRPDASPGRRQRLRREPLMGRHRALRFLHRVEPQPEQDNVLALPRIAPVSRRDPPFLIRHLPCSLSEKEGS